MKRVCDARLARGAGLVVQWALWMAILGAWPGGVPAQERVAVEEPADSAGPIGQFLTLPATIDDVALGRVNRVALALQARALEEKRRGILVLEITPGSSPFHQVRGLAKFLISDIPQLRTVAWIPRTVTGNHAVLALACREIAMAPEAELGDISLGKALDPDEQAFVVNLANKRHNPFINEALVLGLLDRQRELLWVQLEKGEAGKAERESRVVLRQGLEDLQRSGVQLPEVLTIKEAGTPGVFSGERCRRYRILATHVVAERADVAQSFQLPPESMRENAVTGEPPRAVIIRIEGPIEPQLEHFVVRQIGRAVSAGKNLLIFEIDSPGGYLGPSETLAMTIAELKKRKVHAVAWIPREAYSGAAIIALGCDEIYLKPEAMFGDAEPIELKPGGGFDKVPEKLVSELANKLEFLAALKGRPPALAGAMADKELRVFQVTDRQTSKVWYMSEAEIQASNDQWIKGAPVPECEGNRLLTVTGKRAHDLHLAEPPATDFDDLKSRLGIPPTEQVSISEQTWVDSLIFTLNHPAVTGLLLFLGFLCIYFEAHFPLGIFGITAVLCFVVFFWSRFLGGTAGWLEVLLFLVGAGCLALEVFVLPGFGVFGITGILLCLLSLIMAMQTTIIPLTSGDMGGLAGSVGTIFGAILGVLVMAAVVGKYLPSIPFLNQMVLTPPGFNPDELGPRLRPELAGESRNSALERDRALIGRTGRSVTMLRPAGRAQIGDDYVDVVSEGAFIPAGRPIEVVDVAGIRVVVREVT